MLAKARIDIQQTVDAIVGKSSQSTALAAILLACFDGLALQALMDPKFDLEGAYAVLKHMGMGYLERKPN